MVPYVDRNKIGKAPLDRIRVPILFDFEIQQHVVEKHAFPLSWLALF